MEYDTAKSNLSQLKTMIPSNTKILLLCNRANQARECALVIKDMGFSNWSVIVGGMIMLPYIADVNRSVADWFSSLKGTDSVPSTPVARDVSTSSVSMASRVETFKKSNPQYGYNNKIASLRSVDFPLLIPCAQDSVIGDQDVNAWLQFLKSGDKSCYLDCTGATLFPKSNLDAFYHQMTSALHGNPHSDNPSSQRSSAVVDSARNSILAHFGVNRNTHTLVFTANATAALKLVGEMFPWNPASEYRYFEANHNSVLGIRELALLHGALVTMTTEYDPMNASVTVAKGNHDINQSQSTDDSYSLFAFPAECNFTGRKYPLSWIDEYHNKKDKKWLVVLDTAALAPCSELDLNTVHADFCVFSMYKIFGFPTGCGALIMRNEAISLLNKTYWGGGSVTASLSEERFTKFREFTPEKFEDGTVNFQGILASKIGISFIDSLGMTNIREHTSCLAYYLSQQLMNMKHSNGARVCIVNGVYDKDHHTQGPILNSLFYGPNGENIGYKTIVCERLSHVTSRIVWLASTTFTLELVVSVTPVHVTRV